MDEITTPQDIPRIFLGYWLFLKRYPQELLRIKMVIWEWILWISLADELIKL